MFTKLNGQNITTDSIVKKRKNLIILPILYKSPETGFAFGVGGLKIFNTSFPDDSLTRTSNFEMAALITQRKQLLISPVFTIFFKKEKYILRGINAYHNTQEYYFGIGNQLDEKKLISFQYLQFSERVMRKIKKFTFIGLQYQFYDVWNVGTDATMPVKWKDVSGSRGSLSSGLGPSITFDSRDYILNPTKGIYIDISNTIYSPSFGSEYKFANFLIDIRKFIPVKNNVIAFQFISNINVGDIPFKQLSYLGGPRTLRGYYSGQYRDKILHVVQGEYRFKIYRNFGMTTFAGIGKVEKKLEANIQYLKTSGGIGFRYMIDRKDRVNIRADIGFHGFQKDKIGIYIQIAEAF